MASITSPAGAGEGNRVFWAIVTVTGLYLLSAIWGLPQYATELVTSAHGSKAIASDELSHVAQADDAAHH
ncbi:MAG: hypothetical protein MI725_10735, partial [Pirellulales bacterium]|nr:hypothetical protein [Pirellulales bacterium]